MSYTAEEEKGKNSDLVIMSSEWTQMDNLCNVLEYCTVEQQQTWQRVAAGDDLICVIPSPWALTKTHKKSVFVITHHFSDTDQPGVLSVSRGSMVGTLPPCNLIGHPVPPTPNRH